MVSYGRINAPARVPPEKVIAQVQNEIERAAEKTDTEQNRTTLLKDAALVAGQVNHVKHGLGYVPRGWKVVTVDAATSIWESTSTSTDLCLETLGDCTIDIEVF